MQIATQLINFLIANNFLKLDDSSSSRSQKFYDGYLWVELIEDLNKEIFIELCCKDIDNIRDWYDMDLIRYFILKSPYKDEENIRFEQLSTFFISNYLVIKEAFSEKFFPITETALKALQKERTKVLFGY